MLPPHKPSRTEDDAMSDANKPSMLKLPNGNFLYPLRFQSINAIRKGSPPNLWIVLDCLTTEGDTKVERIQFETYKQADAMGRVFAEAMAKHFPEVPVLFIEQA